jgi:hypothetical protein
MMEEAEFWGRLVRHVNQVIRAYRDNNVRFLWGDDLVPGSLQWDQDDLLAHAFSTEDGGRSFVHYKMRMSFSRSAPEAYRKAEWNSLLPDPAYPGWLEISRVSKEIHIYFF